MLWMKFIGTHVLFIIIVTKLQSEISENYTINYFWDSAIFKNRQFCIPTGKLENMKIVM